MVCKAISMAEFQSIGRRYSRGKLMKTIMDFMESGHEVCEVFWEENEYKSAYTLSASLHKSIRKCNVACRAVCYDRRVFLVRKEST